MSITSFYYLCLFQFYLTFLDVAICCGEGGCDTSLCCSSFNSASLVSDDDATFLPACFLDALTGIFEDDVLSARFLN